MTTRITTPALRRRSVRGAALLGLLAAGVSAGAQQTTNPGDIIVERAVNPRSAFVAVPKNEDPVMVRATTFPKNSFDPTISTLVSDTDLTNAHGSTGVAAGGVLGNNSAGVQAVTHLLVGSQTGGNVPLGAGGQVGGGLGGTISSTVTGALAPLTNALGALGAMK